MDSGLVGATGRSEKTIWIEMDTADARLTFPNIDIRPGGQEFVFVGAEGFAGPVLTII